ncbi:MAG: hypothetical protein COA91_00790 [Robiginitomaculum sp.]|nr:MAG: hypothetical protein COA91_00790 [Robiginitomaculum sp.]
MIELITNFSADVKAGPIWVYYWVNFMGLMFVLSIAFAFKRVEARWIALATLLAAPIIMFWLYHKFGYERVLGWGHIIAWPPVLIYLWKRKTTWRVKGTLAGKWIALTVTVMLISLAFDVTDVVRYALGHPM